MLRPPFGPNVLPLDNHMPRKRYTSALRSRRHCWRDQIVEVLTWLTSHLACLQPLVLFQSLLSSFRAHCHGRGLGRARRGRSNLNLCEGEPRRISSSTDSSSEVPVSEVEDRTTSILWSASTPPTVETSIRVVPPSSYHFHSCSFEGCVLNTQHGKSTEWRSQSPN